MRTSRLHVHAALALLALLPSSIVVGCGGDAGSEIPLAAAGDPTTPDENDPLPDAATASDGFTTNDTSTVTPVDASVAPDAPVIDAAPPEAGSPDAAVDAAKDPCDLDGDGYKGLQCAGGTDCDDNDPLTHPGQKEADDWTSSLVDTDYHPCPTCTTSSQLTAWRFWDLALALAPDGTARIAVVWNDPQKASLRLYTEQANGSFTKEDVELLDASGKSNTAIAVDAAGNVHLAYIKSVSAQPNNIATLRYATKANGAWTFADIDDVWDWYAPFGFAIEPSGKAHFVHVSRHPNVTPTLDHVTRTSDGALKREPVGTATIPSEISMALDGSKLQGMFRVGNNLTAFTSLAAGGFTLTPTTALGGSGLVTTLGPQGSLHASHFNASKTLQWTRASGGSYVTDPIITLDSPEQQKAGIVVGPSRTDFFVDAKPPSWNIRFLTQVTYQGTKAAVNIVDSIGNCTTHRCRLPLVVRSDGSLRGAAIHHFFAGALSQWQDKLVFYRRAKTDGIDRSCNGE